MESVNIHEAKTHLSRLLTRVEQGEDVIIARAGKPIARLTAVGGDEGARVLGRDVGLFDVPDDFDSPLPNELLEAFHR